MGLRTDLDSGAALRATRHRWIGIGKGVSGRVLDSVMRSGEGEGGSWLGLLGDYPHGPEPYEKTSGPPHLGAPHQANPLGNWPI
jgi:hypothetical protein